MNYNSQRDKLQYTLCIIDILKCETKFSEIPYEGFYALHFSNMVIIHMSIVDTACIIMLILALNKI